LLHGLLPQRLGWLVLGIAASSLLASRSLYDHVRAVAAALERDGLAAGRDVVARIVGRNPAVLDEAGVARAAIESLAENFSDAVVAPALWCAVLGLPGIALYKAINTADSMLGHRTPRHEAFGWASARLDDVVNLPASRLAGLLLALAAGRGALGALAAMRRDAPRHRSPNAGWPEAAMAGALGLRLAGLRVYGATRIDDAWMGDGRAEAGVADIHHALALYRRACALLLALLTALALIAQS
jgi:adenosylcobinamide-phosphate synthase